MNDNRISTIICATEVDRITGYRFYQLEQIDTMNYIQRLKRYGFSLEEIQSILAISDNNELNNRLRQQEEKLKLEQQKVAIILNELQKHISVFERTGDIMTYQKGYTIEVKSSPSMNVLANRAMMGVDEFEKYYGTLFERVPQERVTPTGLNGARYYDEEFDRDSSEIEVFIGIKEKEKADVVMEPVECAMTVHRGGYSTLSEAYGRLRHGLLSMATRLPELHLIFISRHNFTHLHQRIGKRKYISRFGRKNTKKQKRSGINDGLII